MFKGSQSQHTGRSIWTWICFCCLHASTGSTAASAGQRKEPAVRPGVAKKGFLRMVMWWSTFQRLLHGNPSVKSLQDYGNQNLLTFQKLKPSHPQRLPVCWSSELLLFQPPLPIWQGIKIEVSFFLFRICRTHIEYITYNVCYATYVPHTCLFL
jgi:hypothetical protein